MNKREQVVVVLSRSHATGIGVVRALGEAGYKVDMVSSVRKEGISDYASKSKYLNRFVEVVSPKFHSEGETDSALVDALMYYRGKYDNKPVLFPTDDYTTSIMDENRDILKDIFLMPGIVSGESNSLAAAMDKTFQANLAREVGILTPKEWMISLQTLAISIPKDMVYPCFVKPLESVTGYKKEMAVCNDRKALQAHLKKLKNRKSNRSILVQEYLKIDREIDLSGVCIDQEIIIPAIIRKTCVAKYEKGVTLSGMIYPFDDLGDYCDKVISMMKQFHYVGMFDLEFNVVGNRIYFNEVNFRSGGPNYSYFKSGANLPDVFVNEIVEHTHDPQSAEVNRFGLNFIYEKVAWEDFLNGKMSKEQLEARLRDADCGLLYTPDDPEPYKAYIKRVKKGLRDNKKLDRHKKIANSSFVLFWKNWKDWALVRKCIAIEGKLKIRREGYPQLKKKNQRGQYNSRPRVLVAGRNYCSNLTMARSLGKAGYDVEVLRVYQTKPTKNDWARNMKPDMYSKYIKAYYSFVTNHSDLALRDELKRIADNNTKMLLIPADDLVASVVDLHYNALKKYYIMPNVNNKQGEINRLMRKGVQKELARQAGLPVLNSCVIAAENGQFRIPDSINYPCFIKADVSRYAAKSRMHRCDNEEELSGWLTVFSEKRAIEMVVEDYVEIVNEYSLLGVSSKEGAIGPAAFVAVRGGTKEHKGVALTGKILDVETMQPLFDKLTEFMSSLNFEGLYDIDLIETSDGKIYFVEINMRLGASGYAFTECGVNLPGIFADYMIYHKKLDKNVKVTNPGKIFASEKVLLDEYAGNRISKADYMSIMEESDIFFIKDENDPKAYEVFRRYFKKATKDRSKISDTVKLEDLSLQERLGRAERRVIDNVMRKTSWTEQKTIAEMTRVKDTYGISFVEYESNNLIGLSDEEIEWYCEQVNLRNQAIKSVAEKAKVTEEEAREKMEQARKEHGISFMTYDAINLWKIPATDQKSYINSARKTKCTDKEFYRYQFKKLTLEQQKNIFLSHTSAEIQLKYNVDDAFLSMLEGREQFFRFFRMLYKRPCLVTNKSSKGQFIEAFSDYDRVVYKALDKEAYPDTALIHITPENIGAVYDKLGELAPGIVEPCLKQHEALEKLSPNGMVKVRVVTVSSNTEAVKETGEQMDIAYVAILMGGDDAQQHQFYNGDISAIVSATTGCVITNAANSYCKKYIKHPVSGERIKTYQIPYIPETVALVQTMIKRKNIQGYLAWDFVITERGPMLVDVKTHPESVVLSAPYAVDKKGKAAKMKKYL